MERPLGSEAVVMDNGGTLVIDRFAVSDSAVDEESVASTVKEDWPTMLGVPVMAPVDASRVSPGGREPEVIDQV